MVEVIHAAFGARPALDPPSTASEETAESVAATLARGGGVYAEVDGRPGRRDPGRAGRRRGSPPSQRVSVHPDFQRHGIASAMVAAAEELAAAPATAASSCSPAGEFAELITFWEHRGFVVDRPAPHGVVLAKDLPVVVARADRRRHAGPRRAAGGRAARRATW